VTFGSFVGEHATGCLPEESWGGFVVNETTTRVCIDSSVGDFMSLKSVSEEWAWNLDLIATNNDDTLTIEQLFSDYTGETAK